MSNFTQSLHGRVASACCAYLDVQEDRSAPVVRLRAPSEVKAAFEEIGVPLSLLGNANNACSDDKLMEAVNLVLNLSVRTGSPFFFNQLYGRAAPASIAGDWVSAATNTNGHTYEVAPVYTVMEREVLAKCATDLLGGPYYGRAHDGLMVAGGSLSNLYGLTLARARADPKANTRGLHGGPRLVAFCSEQAHYSYLKSARLLGIGSDNLIKVKSDHRSGRMDVEALKIAIDAARESGGVPFFVGSTAGTTVLGAYDDFTSIQDVIDRENSVSDVEIWHHIDGCWGGSAMVSPRLKRAYMGGAERADSIAWNPHKMMGAALQTSIFLTRHPKALASTNGTQASYLFQPDKLNNQYDCGDKTIQCGRKTDALKLWMLWKQRGDAGMAASAEKCFHLAMRFREGMAKGGDAWHIVGVPSCTNVCFWYIPKRLRPWNPETATEAEREDLNKIAPTIKAKMQEAGLALIGFQSDAFIEHGDINFFRMVFAACDIHTDEDTDEVLLQIDRIGADL